MQKRPFGRAGVLVPELGQGTWNMERDDRADCVASLRRGLELGLTHIDTAELYGRGRVEETIVAEAIAGRRDEVFLVSKILPTNASGKGTIRACEGSLKRLKTDRLDCYLLHWPGNHPLAETIAAFEDLVRQGKIRAWGVSNFDADDLREALRIAGPGRIACNQVQYHLEERAIEHAVVPLCEEAGIAVVAYSPFAVGRFPPKGAGGRVLSEIALRHGVTPHQVALRFLIRRPGSFAIPKSARVEHLEDNARAAALALSDDDLRAIDAAFPAGRPRALPSI